MALFSMHRNEVPSTEPDSSGTSLTKPEPVDDDFPWIDFAFFFTTTAAIVFLNGIVLIILAKIGAKKLRKSIHNVQILSLSVSDTMVGITLIPMQISFYAGEMAHLECAIRCGVFMVAFMASMLHVCIICIDRWWVIYFKVAQTQTQFIPRCILLITSTWALAFVIEFIPLVLWRSSTMGDKCSIGTIFGDFFNEAFIYMACTHTTVLVSVTLFYCIIIVSIMKRRSQVNIGQTENLNNNISEGNVRKESENSYKLPNVHVISIRKSNGSNTPQSINSTTRRSEISSTAKRNSDARQRRALKTIGLIVSIHILCVGPLIIMLFVEVTSNNRASLTWHHAMICIACLSSAGNPLLYAFRVPEIRKMLKNFRKPQRNT